MKARRRRAMPLRVPVVPERNTPWPNPLIPLPGSSFIKRMVKKYRPQAIIGVGCLSEVKEGIDMADKLGLPVPTRDELAGLLGLSGTPASLFTPAVAELVAIGAAIAANCEPCLRYHIGEAGKLGVSVGDMARAVEMAAKVKDAPHRNIMRLAARLTQTVPAAAVATPGACFEGASGPGNAVKGCGCS